MKKNIFLTILAFCLLSSSLIAQEQFIISGSAYNKIAVINRSGEIIWDYKVDNSNCNHVEITKDGSILYSNGDGAYLINREKEVIWSYLAKENEKLYTSTQLKNGDYLLACCGHPSRIIELSKSGKVIKEITFETGIPNMRKQLRQISKTSKGNYIVPTLATGTIIELDKNGKEVRKIKVGRHLFQVNLLSKKQWIAAGADGHDYIFIEPSTGEVIKRIGQDDIKGCQIKFAAEINQLDNGNFIFANWSGHGNDHTQPIIAEIDSDNKLIWSINRSEAIHSISTVFPIKKKHHF